MRKIRKPGEVNVDSLLDSHRYELLVQTQQQQLASQSKVIKAEIASRRQALVEADKQVRILEKLRDRKQEEYQQEQLQQQHKEMDEVAIRRYADQLALSRADIQENQG